MRFFDDLMFKNSPETQRTAYLTKKDCVSVIKRKKTEDSEMQNALRFFAFQCLKMSKKY